MKTSHPSSVFRFLLLFGALASLTVVAKADDKDAKKSDEKKEKSTVVAITGADIHTVTKGVVRQGTILIKDGKISELGSNVTVPEDAEVIDAKGKIITPGFVAISMRGVGFRQAPTGANKLGDGLNPFDQNIRYALGVGITTGCAELSRGGGRFRFGSPGEPEDRFPGLEKPMVERLTEEMLDYGNPDTALCPCCGLPVLPTEPITPSRPSSAKPRKMAVIKLAYGNLDAMLTKEKVFFNPSPGALNGALNRHNWRIELKKARAAIKAQKVLDKEKEKSKSKSSAKSAASKTSKSSKSKKPTVSPEIKAATATVKKAKPELIALLKGETKMRVRADAYDEISDLTDLALEYDYDLIIEGGTEAWALKEKLSTAGVQLIYTPRRRREPQKGRETNSGSNFESPRIFEKIGIPFSTMPLSTAISMNGLAGRDLTSLPLEAAFAVRGGASEKAALESITIAPARMLGLDDRIGSLEVGKDADLLILNGGPLDYKTYVETAIVAGEVSYERGKAKVYPVYERED